MNIDAVARRAKVSTATVSRVLNNSDRVRERTAERVRKAIEELGYVPNLHARSLSSGRSGLYGLIVSDLTNPFFPDLISAFERHAVEHGAEVIIANTNYSAARLKNYIERFLARKVDGLGIMTSELHGDVLEQLKRAKIPLVFLNQPSLGRRVATVRVNYEHGFEQAIQHLIDLGHQDIAFISGPPTLNSAVRRREAVMELVRKKKVRVDESWLVAGNHRFDGGYAAMEKVLRGPRIPTAVLASNDLTALGALGAIQEHGLKVPEDISVVGFDDLPLVAMLHPKLTTIRLSREEIATRAFFALYTAGSSKPMAMEAAPIAPQLIVRETTGPAKMR